MHKPTHSTRWWVAGLLAVAPAIFAQQTPPPAAPAPVRQAPPPEDLEPGVNTSAMPANTAPTPPAPASVAPRPAAAAAATSDTLPAPQSAPKVGKPAKSSTAPATTGAASAVSAASNSGAGAGTKGGKAEDHLQLDTTQITGNQELPKVLYIVPWKRSDLGDMLGRPANSLLDEVLQPVDRDVFRRENRYYDALKPDAAGAAGKATGAPVQASGDKH